MSDILSVQNVNNAFLEFTTACNLRCVYCPTSQPSYVSKTFPVERLESLIQELKLANTVQVHCGGHGETTIIKGWQNYCRQIIQSGMGAVITSNFAKEFSNEEIEVLSQMWHITVSCDTCNRRLFQELRHPADLTTVLYNITRVRAEGIKNGRSPVFILQCVVSDRSVFDLENWVLFGIAAGIDKFSLGNLVEHKNQTAAKSIFSLSAADKVKAGECIAAAKQLAEKHGKTMYIQGSLLDSVNVDTHTESIDRRFGTVYNFVVKEGETRDCIEPWMQMYIQVNGDVWPCCWYYDSKIGNIHDEPFHEIVNGDRVRQLRAELLSGQLGKNCLQCPAMRLTTVEELKQRVLNRPVWK